MREFFRNIIPMSIKDKLLSRYSMKSYSQEGEDTFLWRFFNHKHNGRYVDIGAHHPYIFSNTALLYTKGWSGINIDPNPESIKLLSRARNRDVNICQGIAKASGELKYYEFSQPSLNGFSEALSTRRHLNSFPIKATTLVPVAPLTEIVSKSPQIFHNIDLLNIDIEGLEYDALQSNNWEIFRPKVVCVEILVDHLADVLLSDVHIFLESIGYELRSRCFYSCFYIDNTQVKS